MSNLLLLADIASKSSSNLVDIAVQTEPISDFIETDLGLGPIPNLDLLGQHDFCNKASNSDEFGCQNLSKTVFGPRHSYCFACSSNLFGHDYIIQNDFEVLVNANHDYYNRISQTDDDYEHSYAFPIGQDLSEDIDSSVGINNNNGDEFIFEGIANLDEHMGLSGSNNEHYLEEIVSNEPTQSKIDTLPNNQSQSEPKIDDFSSTNDDFEMILLSDAVKIIQNEDQLHFDDILRYMNSNNTIDDYYIVNQKIDKTTATPPLINQLRDLNANNEPELIPTNENDVPEPIRNMEESLVTCFWGECQASFEMFELFINHVRNHVTSLNYKFGFICQWRNCQKGGPYKKRYLLERHLKVHTLEKPYDCHVCSKSFPLKSRLTDHLRKHSGEKPFSCKFCQKKFAVWGDLSRHHKTHSQKSTYICPTCQKPYKDDSGLRKHLKNGCKNEKAWKKLKDLCKLSRNLEKPGI